MQRCITNNIEHEQTLFKSSSIFVSTFLVIRNLSILHHLVFCLLKLIYTRIRRWQLPTSSPMKLQRAALP